MASPLLAHSYLTRTAALFRLVPSKRIVGFQVHPRTALLAATFVIATPVIALTQTAGSRLILQNGESAGKISRDPLGRPCLDVEAASRSHITNPNVYDHIVSISNRCLKSLKVRVCYLDTERCTDMEVLRMGRKDVIIGTNPAMKRFKFRYQEIL
jgi:hypothetical protein